MTFVALEVLFIFSFLFLSLKHFKIKEPNQKLFLSFSSCIVYPFMSRYPFCAIYKAKMNGNELQRWMMPTKDMLLSLTESLGPGPIKNPTLWKATQL